MVDRSTPRVGWTNASAALLENKHGVYTLIVYVGEAAQYAVNSLYNTLNSYSVGRPVFRARCVH